MKPIILQHCNPVRIAVFVDPTIVSVNLITGGNDGDGIVNVQPASCVPPAPFCSQPTNTTFVTPTPAVVELWLHYVKSPTGPDEIAVAFDVTMI